jgi:hypothetical protein
MTMMTQQQMAQEVTRWLKDPHKALLKELSRNGDSSLELSRQTGVPGATIRSLRNGQSAAVTANTWGRLMRHLQGARWKALSR